MLLNNKPPSGEYHHNYIRLGFLLGTVILFVGYIIVDQLFEQGNNVLFGNKTFHVEDLIECDIIPSSWVYKCLTVFNYFWQLSWLLYSLTFIYRRSAGGYLYLSPSTLTPTFSIIYILGFVIQPIWLVFFYKKYIMWTWLLYLASFLLLSLSLFVINNNLAVNKKIYETEGLNLDIWCLRFFAQNGVAFFACWTAIRFILALDVFLQIRFALSVINAGTISLGIIALIAGAFFFGTNLNAVLIERCSYQFSPWLVFIVFFWGVVENNWTPKDPQRNSIMAAIELLATLVSAIFALALFTMRYRTSKIDPIG